MSSRHRSRSERQHNIGSGDWANKYGLFHELLPYGYREHTPIETLSTLREDFESMGRFKQLWQSKDVSLDLRHCFHPRNRLRYICFSGAWPVLDHRRGNAYSYANPLYVHDRYPPVESKDKREELIRETHDIPYWHAGRLAIALGVSQRTASRYRKQLVGRVRGERHNMTKLGRTVKTITSWGYTYAEISSALPYSTGTLRNHVYSHARDFDPPENPL